MILTWSFFQDKATCHSCTSIPSCHTSRVTSLSKIIHIRMDYDSPVQDIVVAFRIQGYLRINDVYHCNAISRGSNISKVTNMPCHVFGGPMDSLNGMKGIHIVEEFS